MGYSRLNMRHCSLSLCTPAECEVEASTAPGLKVTVSFPQFHSHQLFHVFVVAGAFVHFHGVSNLQEFRFTVGGGCSEEDGMQ